MVCSGFTKSGGSEVKTRMGTSLQPAGSEFLKLASTENSEMGKSPKRFRRGFGNFMGIGSTCRCSKGQRPSNVPSTIVNAEGL